MDFLDSRLKFRPILPSVLQGRITMEPGGEVIVGGADHAFPNTASRSVLHPVCTDCVDGRKLRVGVLFSGGPAPGGHNVVIGLFDGLKLANPGSTVVGIMGGPAGLLDGRCQEIGWDRLGAFYNQGGFDLLGSGRTKIESEDQIDRAIGMLSHFNLDGLVVVGGDDSNTNAAVLAEHCSARGNGKCIIGVPKTIDGDIGGPYIDTTFGFHTATSTYSEVIGNIAKDAISAKKYNHFIKLMGRSSSHVVLECALKTKPNLAIIGEEVFRNNISLLDVAKTIAQTVTVRSERGMDYGVVLIPEGLIESIPEMKVLIEELNCLIAEGKDHRMLSSSSRRIFDLLPEHFSQTLFAGRDPHGNIHLSSIRTERLLCELVEGILPSRVQFNPVLHSLGYEGRAAYPTNFDATYCYALGYISSLLVRGGNNGYMASAYCLSNSWRSWQACGIPITSLMGMERRKGANKPVVRKSVVDLDGSPYRQFVADRDLCVLEDRYRSPGPIQFEGVCSHDIPLSLSLMQR